MENQNDARGEKIAALEARLEALEKSNARLEKWRAGLHDPDGDEFLNVGVLHAAVMELKRDGKRRGYFASHEDGAEFCLYDGDERMRVKISVDSSEENGVNVQIFGDARAPDADENSGMADRAEAVRLGLGPEGGLLALFDDEARPRVVSRAQKSGGTVVATNRDGKALAILRSGEEGGKLELLPDTWGETGEAPVVNVALTATAQGGALMVRDETGAQMGMAAHAHSTLLFMGDDDCDQRIALASTAPMTAITVQSQDNGPQMRLLAMDENVSFSLQNCEGEELGQWMVISDPQKPDDQQCVWKLFDSNGIARLGSHVTSTLATLELSDKNEQKRVSFLASDNVGGMQICDENGVGRVQIQDKIPLLLRAEDGRIGALMNCDDGARLVLFSAPAPDEQVELLAEDEIVPESPTDTAQILKRGQTFLDGPATRQRVVLAARPEAAGLVLQGPATEEQFLLSAESTSILQIKDAEGTVQLDLRSTSDGGAITASNDAGAARVKLGVRPDEDSGILALIRSGGEPDVMIGANDEGGVLHLFDEHGELSAELPDRTLG